MKPLPDEFRRALLSDNTSKLNKIWLATTWKDDGYYVEYKWNAYRDQVKVQFEIDGEWQTSKCFDDVHRNMKELK